MTTTFELALVASFSVASIPFHSKSCGLMPWATIFLKISDALRFDALALGFLGFFLKNEAHAQGVLFCLLLGFQWSP